MIEYYSHRAGHTFEGVEILRYRVVLPSFSDLKCISEFYHSIYDRVVSYCEVELKKYAEKKYAECTIQKKKFNYPPIVYSLSGRVTAEDRGLIFVKLTATATQRGISDTVCVYDAHVWSASDERLIPPQTAAKEYFGGGTFRQIGKNGFLIENGKPFICLHNKLVPLEERFVHKSIDKPHRRS